MSSSQGGLSVAHWRLLLPPVLLLLHALLLLQRMLPRCLLCMS
jgi:hypothetical protein